MTSAPSQIHRIDELNEGVKKITEDNKAIYQLASSVEVIATRMGNIENKVDEANRKITETSKKVSEIENRPAKQVFSYVNSVKVAVWTTVVSLLVVYEIICMIGGTSPNYAYS